MSPRTTRVEQMAANRERVLTAAGEVFRDRGFYAASVDEIAEAAGFSKGVVYSQFGSKADLFLALLERRIEERARENLDAAARLTPGSGLRPLWQLVQRAHRADPRWTLLVIEFRTHAAREPALQQRYAALHGRTLRGVADTARLAATMTGTELPYPAEDVARLLFAVSNGYLLEDIATPSGELSDLGIRAVALLLGLPVGEITAQEEQEEGDPDDHHDSDHIR